LAQSPLKPAEADVTLSETHTVAISVRVEAFPAKAWALMVYLPVADGFQLVSAYTIGWLLSVSTEPTVTSFTRNWMRVTPPAVPGRACALRLNGARGTSEFVVGWSSQTNAPPVLLPATGRLHEARMKAQLSQTAIFFDKFGNIFIGTPFF
jgi:hypothetical protein